MIRLCFIYLLQGVRANELLSWQPFTSSDKAGYGRTFKAAVIVVTRPGDPIII